MPKLNWQVFLLLLCLAAWSDGQAQGHICKMQFHRPGEICERDWTTMVGGQRIGLSQARQVRDSKGKGVVIICFVSPQDYEWHRYTTVHLGFTQFTTRGPSWLVATLANALPFALALTLFFWRRSRRGLLSNRSCNPWK